MFFRKLNSTFIPLTFIVAAGFMLSTTQQAKAAYTDYCPLIVNRANQCPTGTETDSVAAQLYCATLYHVNPSGPSDCCMYRGYNVYCVAADGTRTKAGGGQNAIYQSTQTFSGCASFRCQYF